MNNHNEATFVKKRPLTGQRNQQMLLYPRKIISRGSWSWHIVVAWPVIKVYVPPNCFEGYDQAIINHFSTEKACEICEELTYVKDKSCLYWDLLDFYCWGYFPNSYIQSKRFDGFLRIWCVFLNLSTARIHAHTHTHTLQPKFCNIL